MNPDYDRFAGEYSLLLEGTSGKEHKQEICLRECQPQFTSWGLGVKTCAVLATCFRWQASLHGNAGAYAVQSGEPAVAMALAQAGAEITLVCRSEEKARSAADRIRKDVPHARLELGLMDLSSLRSVRDFAEGQLATDRPVDALINNAGIMAPRERLVSKGWI